MPADDKIMGQQDGEENYNVDDDNNIFVNAEDGLRLEAMDEENNANNEARQRLQYRILNGEWEDFDINLDEIIDEDFPTNLIVTGFNVEFFEQDELKKRLESLFQLYGEDAAFHYFKSFKRVRVTYASAASAIQARIKMHGSVLGENILKCYFGQNPVSCHNFRAFLKVDFINFIQFYFVFRL